MKYIALLLFALAGVGCGPSAWREVVTPHFVLRTDLDAEDARHAGLALEETRHALVSATWPKFPFSNKPDTTVYVLSNGIDFERYFGALVGGIFIHDPPTFFLYGAANRWELRSSSHRPTPSVLRHEMTHQLSAEVFKKQPRWFAEGLAQFLETIYLSDDGDSILIGGVNTNAYLQYRSIRNVTLRETLDWNAPLSAMSEREAGGLYGTSWFFIHWMYNTHPDAFGKLQDALGDGTDGNKALQRALPGFDTDKVEKELFEYNKHGKFDEFAAPFAPNRPTASSFSEHLLSKAETAEVHNHLEAFAKAREKKKKEQSARDTPERTIARALLLDGHLD